MPSADVTVPRDALGITAVRRYVFPDLLVPFSWYEFRVSAANPLGYGPPSPPSPRYNTAPARPFTPPTQIHGGGGKIGDLTIKWKVRAAGGLACKGAFGGSWRFCTRGLDVITRWFLPMRRCVNVNRSSFYI